MSNCASNQDITCYYIQQYINKKQTTDYLLTWTIWSTCWISGSGLVRRHRNWINQSWGRFLVCINLQMHLDVKFLPRKFFVINEQLYGSNNATVCHYTNRQNWSQMTVILVVYTCLSSQRWHWLQTVLRHVTLALLESFLLQKGSVDTHSQTSRCCFLYLE